MANNGHNGHHVPEALGLTPAEITADQVSRVVSPGPKYRTALILSGALFALGIVGFVIRALEGFDDRSIWGYYAATMVWLLTTAGAAPLSAFAFRMTKANWRKPMVRAAEIWGAVTIYIFLLLIPMYFMIPSSQTGADSFRPTIWFHASWGAPHLWSAMGMLGFIIAAVCFFWITTVPDHAVLRDSDSTRSWNRRLAVRWRGTSTQWQILQVGIILFGTFFFMGLFTAHFLVPSDFALALVPGWKDAIFPAYHMLTALQGGLATLIVTMYVMRRWGGLSDYIKMEPFWALTKPLIATCFLWFYFWWCAFIVYWFGRSDGEIGVLRYIQFETYRPFFLAGFLLCFLIPGILLIANPVRKSIIGPTIVSLIILVGLFFDRIRIYVASFGVPNDEVGHHAFDLSHALPAMILPDAIDIMMIVGAISGAVFVYLLVTRLVPPISMWEMKEDVLLRVIRPLLRGTYTLIGKPR